MPDENENNIPISELDEALDLTDSAQFPYTQNNGGTLTTFKARLTQIAAKIIEGLSFAGINLPTSAGDKTVENSINFLLDSVGGDPNGNISDSYDPTAAYVKGDLCIYENVLYICTAPTTGTFDPSKWTATTIDNVIGSLSTLTTTDKSSIVGAVNEVNAVKTTNIATTGYSDVGIALVKVNKVVQFKFTGLKSLPTGGWTKIADLPSGYRPKMETIEDIFDNTNRKLRFKIEIGGSVYVYNYGTAISSDFNAYMNLTYIIA